MIRVNVGTNTTRVIKTIDPGMTLKALLEENEINYTTGNLTLDGCQLQAGDINKTFTELGITESCYLISVTKAENALN